MASPLVSQGAPATSAASAPAAAASSAAAAVAAAAAASSRPAESALLSSASSATAVASGSALWPEATPPPYSQPSVLAPIGLLTSTSPGYLCPFNNWMRRVRSISEVPVTVGVYHNPFKASVTQAAQASFARRLDTRGETRVVWRAAASAQQSFWAWRLRLLCELLEPSSRLRAYQVVAYTDLDAMWLADPTPALLAAHATGFHVVASMGSYPPGLRAAWAAKYDLGHTLCMGFASFKSDEATARALTEILAGCEPRGLGCDDQVALNEWLDAHGSWERGSAAGVLHRTAHATAPLLAPGVTPLRFAALSMSFAERAEGAATSRPYAGNASVVHPLSAKSQRATTAVLQTMGLWQLPACSEDGESEANAGNLGAGREQNASRSAQAALAPAGNDGYADAEPEPIVAAPSTSATAVVATGPPPRVAQQRVAAESVAASALPSSRAAHPLDRPLASSAGAAQTLQQVPQHQVCGEAAAEVTAEGGLQPAWLWSYPGSGNTFARMLVEAATGMLTGSVYYDPSLYGQFAGEAAPPCAAGQVMVKNHAFDSEDLQSSRPQCNVHRAVLLIRSPWDAILAEYKRRRGLAEQTGGADQRPGSDAHTYEVHDVDYATFGGGGGGGGWQGATFEAARWKTTMDKMERYSDPKLAVRYEDLLGGGRESALRAMAALCGVEVSAARAACAFEHAGTFHRAVELTAADAFCNGPGHLELRHEVWRLVGEQALRHGYETMRCPGDDSGAGEEVQFAGDAQHQAEAAYYGSNATAQTGEGGRLMVAQAAATMEQRPLAVPPMPMGPSDGGTGGEGDGDGGELNLGDGINLGIREERAAQQTSEAAPPSDRLLVGGVLQPPAAGGMAYPSASRLMSSSSSAAAAAD